MATNTAEKKWFIQSDYIILIAGAVAVIAAGIAYYAALNSLLAFITSAVAVALLASLVGRSVEQLGDRFGPGATGVLQSALGNLPELFIAIFALKAGLVEVVKAALVGSILSNLLLVLGLAFLAGGLKHGAQKLGSDRARTVITLMLLSVMGLAIPSLAHWIHTPAAPHEETFSLIVSVVLLLLFLLYLPASLKHGKMGIASEKDSTPGPRWPLWLAVGLLAFASVLAAFVSDWFVTALEPAMQALNISDAFAGLVIVAIAGNAIENVVGIQLALKGQSEYAFSVIINSPLQIALVLAPLLVIISQVFGLSSLTLVFSPMLMASIFLAIILAAFISFDGESNWLEGAALIAIYIIIATAFWWG
ncbi:calcium/proton exchanger [Hanamia caeni]|jgi:Ca2+:H+ antiporter|uniref:Ca(2+)/H(+) antiporter n=1 Tax=Hanamia caeni TaxID=2294116 RepID=A0A3M9NQN2_9BACT|nr:calcium/proton exchanger [Hanamia caeni]RNI39994.1 calcium/proton exchanger [Hanamia caeni]